MKTCTKCGRTLVDSEFHRDRNRRDGLAPWCKECARANARRHRAENLAVVKTRQRARYRANSDVVKTKVREHYWGDPERARESGRRSWQHHRPERLAYQNVYRQAHPEKVAAAKRAAKAKKPGHYRVLDMAARARRAGVAILPFTATQLEARLAYFGGLCWLCGTPTSATDHVKPLSRGGPHMLANLRPCCRACNSQKGRRWPFNTRRRP